MNFAHPPAPLAKSSRAPKVADEFFERPPPQEQHFKRIFNDRSPSKEETALSHLLSDAAPLIQSAIEEEKKEAAEREASLFYLPPSFSLNASAVSSSSRIALSSQVQDLFNKMVGAMMIMKESELTETTILLDSSQFASSPFFGSKVVIQEFSTAPKAFNIHFIGSPEATALMQAHAGDLVAAFQQNNYSFKVNRLETHIAVEERSLFIRKENVTRDKEEEQ